MFAQLREVQKNFSISNKIHVILIVHTMATSCSCLSTTCVCPVWQVCERSILIASTALSLSSREKGNGRMRGKKKQHMVR